MTFSSWTIYVLTTFSVASALLSGIVCYLFYTNRRMAVSNLAMLQTSLDRVQDAISMLHPSTSQSHYDQFQAAISNLHTSVSSIEAALSSLTTDVKNLKDTRSLDKSVKDSVRDNISNAMKQLGEQLLEQLLKTSPNSLRDELVHGVNSAFEAGIKHFDEHVRPSLNSDLENSLNIAIARLPAVPDIEKRIELALLEKLIPSFPGILSREIDNLISNAVDEFSRRMRHVLTHEFQELHYRRGWPEVRPLDKQEREHLSHLTARGDYDDPWLRDFPGRCRECGRIVLLPR